MSLRLPEAINRAPPFHLAVFSVNEQLIMVLLAPYHEILPPFCLAEFLIKLDLIKVPLTPPQ